jgi:hypothetical protein
MTAEEVDAWLRKTLGRGPVHAMDVYLFAARLGITRERLRRRARQLGVRTLQRTKRSHWFWMMPEDLKEFRSSKRYVR